MFEFSVALKYLIPRKKQLSVSLIALLSVLVISLVVWLVLVFLSVTEGIERGWLQKLTTLNAPLRITPTQRYYSSYYYQIDSVSADSHYTHKNIAKKAVAAKTDPYQPLEDGELPARFPKPEGNDPVKQLFAILSHLQKERSDLVFQDFELSGALMRLQLLRPGNGLPGEETQGYLTQASYLASFPDKCPALTSLLLPPTEKDLNHLLFLSSHSTDLSRQDAPALAGRVSQDIARGRIAGLLKNVKIQRLKTKNAFWQLPAGLFPSGAVFEGIAHTRDGNVVRIDLPVEKGKANVKIRKEKSGFLLEDAQGSRQTLPLSTPILVDGHLFFEVESIPEPLRFNVRTLLQGVPIKGKIGLDEMEIAKADFPSQLPFSNEEKETGVLLAKNFLDNGVMIGDKGYLSYASTTSSSVQEHRLPIFVTGFYDPGILSVGNKCVLVPPFVTRAINATSTSFNLDKTQSNGILVWFDDLGQAGEVKRQIVSALQELDIDAYWKVTTFREYEFAKDLLEQFQSDKSLFALIGIIILIVACCNIISLLVLLVNDKKREIGILRAMGASHFSIAAIFGSCGMAMGILSSILGTAAALFTLQHIDLVVQFLSFIQGHDAFNSTFFGKNLPGKLSGNAVTFILFTTPLLSLLAGLVPAIKACRLRPSQILRSE
jgi:lipoprotein-releasing system permease protein